MPRFFVDPEQIADGRVATQPSAAADSAHLARLASRSSRGDDRRWVEAGEDRARRAPRGGDPRARIGTGDLEPPRDGRAAPCRARAAGRSCARDGRNHRGAHGSRRGVHPPGAHRADRLAPRRVASVTTDGSLGAHRVRGGAARRSCSTSPDPSRPQHASRSARGAARRSRRGVVCVSHLPMPRPITSKLREAFLHRPRFGDRALRADSSEIDLAVFVELGATMGASRPAHLPEPPGRCSRDIACSSPGAG